MVHFSIAPCERVKFYPYSIRGIVWGGWEKYFPVISPVLALRSESLESQGGCNAERVCAATLY